MYESLIDFKTSLIILCLICTKYVHCFHPNCEPDNQFRFTCFTSRYCLSSDYCRTDNCGFYDKSATTSVTIQNAKILPTCAFVDSPLLTQVNGVNSNIRVIASGAFKNLPALEKLCLQFNSIRDIHYGIFHNIPKLSFLDLSYNRIEYIEKNAFSELCNLKTLNLSKNELITVPFGLSQSVEHLVLSYNLLEKVIINSKRFTNLTYIDLSHNLINSLAISIDYPVDTIDLRDNKLFDIDYASIWSVENLLLAVNDFVFLPEYLVDINAKYIQLYPNPWKCEELEKVWNKLLRYEITVSRISDDAKKLPVCSTSNATNYYSASETNKRIEAFKNLRYSKTSCLEDHECLNNQSCRAGKCWDLCTDENLCDNLSICQSFNHTFSCNCPENQIRNPLHPNQPCSSMECFQKSDCRNDWDVCYNGKCVTLDESRETFRTTTRPIHATGEPPVTRRSEAWWWFEIKKPRKNQVITRNGTSTR